MNIAHRTIFHPPSPNASILSHLPFSEDMCVVTATKNLLQVYSVENNQFYLRWEKLFWGDIFAVYSYSSRDEYDTIILGCDTAKIVILQVVESELIETEFHSFIDEDISTRVREPPKLVMDPYHTCLALLIAGNKIYFLTLTKKHIPMLSSYSAIPVGQHSSWDVIVGGCIVDTMERHDIIPSIRDLAFLYVESVPTLAILYEVVPTFSMTLFQHPSTVTVSTITPIYLESLSQFTLGENIWNSPPLPHNSFKIHPIPQPIGGLVVLSRNAVLYLSNTTNLIYQLNDLLTLEKEANCKIVGQSNEIYEIFAEAITNLTPSLLLITVEQHYPALLSLITTEPNTVSSMKLIPYLDLEFHPSKFLTLNSETIIAFSNIQDSEIWKISVHEIEEEPISTLNDQYSPTFNSLYKFFYNRNSRAIRRIPESFRIQKVGVLHQVGTVCCAAPFINFNDIENDDLISMVYATGFKSAGCLNIVQTCITPLLRHRYPYQNYTALFVSLRFSILLISQASSTDGYSIQDEIKTLDSEWNSNIVRTSRTIAASDFSSGFLQITDAEVHFLSLLEDNVPCGKQIFSNGDEIKEARIGEQFFGILTAKGNGYIFNSSFDQVLEMTRVYHLALHEPFVFGLQRTTGHLVLYSLETFQQLCLYSSFKTFPCTLR